MSHQWKRHARAVLAALMVFGGSGVAAPVLAQYYPIDPTMSDKTIVLTGHNLTIEQIVEVARYGAKVQLSPEAKQRNAGTWGLMMEGATEGVPIYLFNRGAGAQRLIVQFTGDPLSAKNEAYFRQRGLVGTLPAYHAPPHPAPVPGDGAYEPPDGTYNSDIQDEDVARAIMLVQANDMTYMPNSPPVLQALIDLLNADVTPVILQRGGPGEAIGPAERNIYTVIRGGGQAYYHGVRMSAAEALQKADLKPTPFAPGDSTTYTTNADVTGMAALLVYDARQLLDWTDLDYAIDLNGMNSSITPLTTVVQGARPFKWLNWDAERVRNMLRGSYLFQADPQRIIQDPESLRASSIRQGAAWKAWAALRDDVTTQMNHTDHNPVVKVGASPGDSWELATPEAMKYYVRGGPESHGQHGFIFSNANWDPYPLGNDLEAFTDALANMDIAVMLRQERFESPFFTVVTARQVLGGTGGYFGGGGGGWSNHEVWQRIQGLINPVPPEGYSSDPEGVEELDAQTLIKVGRTMKAVRESWLLAASDLVVGTRWVDIRKIQDPARTFGAAPTAAWQAFRKISPLRPTRGTQPAGEAALGFITTHPAASFYSGGPVMPGGGN